nr:PREDICTED: uncharacterized protein C6orf132 homolog [Equus przewalskii]
MKKNQTVQGTFSKLFGKKHNAPATSLYATNPPWIFTQEAPEERTRRLDGIYYADNRFDSVSESGTATLKARPRVRPLLTFLPLNSQENHGLAVPTPSVPEDFVDKGVTGTSSLVNGNLRLYSSVGDLRPGHYGQDPLIPPPPPGPAPGPPPNTLQPRGESPPPPPPSMAPPPPPLLLEPPLPPSMTFQSKFMPGPAAPPKSLPGPTTPGPATPPKSIPGPTTPGPATPLKATPGPATPTKSTAGSATPGPAIPSAAPTLPATSSQLIAVKNLVPAGQWEKQGPQELAVPSQPEADRCPSEASKPPTGGALSPPALPPKISPGGKEVTFPYKPHRSKNSPSREAAVVMSTPARGEAPGSGELVGMKEPQGLPAKPPASAQPADELLRHPVTGEVVERGSPMALLLAARQRAQKGRPGGAALSRSSLPGSLRGHSSQPEASSEGGPNSFTGVPKLPKEPEKDLQLASSTQPTVPSQWKPQSHRDPEGTQPSCGHKWTKAEPQAPVAWGRPAPSNLPQGRVLPKSFSSPSSPSHKREEEKEFNFEVIPPPPEFSNDPEPPTPALQYLERRRSPPWNNFSDLGQPLDAGLAALAPRGFPRFPADARSAGPGGLERSAGGGLERPSSRRPAATAAAPPLPAGELGPGDEGRLGWEARSPHSTPLYGSPINTFTVRPGTRHPISCAYSGAHRKAPS